MEALLQVWSHKQGQGCIFLLGFMTFWTLTTILVSHRRNCTALLAFAFWCARDVSILLKQLLSLWIEQQDTNSGSTTYTFGFDRFETLASFGLSIATVLSALYSLKESVGQMIVQSPLLFDDLFVWTCATLVVHAVVSHFAEQKQGKPGMVVALIRILRQRNRNSLPDDVLLYELMSCALLLIAMLFIETTDAAIHMDAVAAMVISTLLVLCTIPDIYDNGITLIQNVATSSVNQLHKCVREMSTFEGILEFFNIHFWTVSNGKLAGTIHVRVRRDANEQVILAQVANKLAHLINPKNLAVQIIKDDWMTSTVPVPMTPRPFDMMSTPSRELSQSSFADRTPSGLSDTPI